MALPEFYDNEPLSSRVEKLAAYILETAPEAVYGGAIESAVRLLDSNRKSIGQLRRCLLPVWMGIAECELVGEPLADSAVVLSFMGSGASDRVTAGEVREALK